MADITVDVNLPSTISVDVTSPTQALATNISIPGPQGPRGEKGNPTTINNLSAENIIITGANGNIVYTTGLNTIFISGNSGYFQSAINNLTTNLNSTGANLNTSINNLSGLFTGYTGTLDATYATDSQLNSTGNTLNIKIDNLSGYVNSQDSSISNNLASTGSSLQSNINTLSSNLNSTGANLENKITSLSGTLTGNYLTTNVASNTYATISNLNSTGSTLNSNINSLSGTLTSNYATITNLSNTGSTLVGTINSLSGTLTSNYATITNLASTGATLINTINSLSGTLTGNYLTTSSTSNTYATITNLASTGATLTSSINSLNSAFTGFTGNLDATYATDSQLQNTGSTLSQNINSLSGTLTGNYYLKSNPSGFITGVDLSSYLTSSTASSTYATITNLNSTGNTLNSSINSLSGTLTGNYVTKSNGQFTNRPTVNGTGVLLSGEAASLPTTILYTTGNQIKSGRLIIGDTIVDPNSPYTLSLQTNYQDTFLEILNSGGSSEGVFVGINRNDFEQYNWQGGDIIFYTAENPNSGIERLYIKNNGNIGIGTNIPSEKLEVNGNIKAATGVYATNLVYNTGNQTISGVKTFNLQPILSGNPLITGVDLSSYATTTNLASTGSTLNNSINSLSGSSVLLYGNQSVGGIKTFRDNVYINNLFVTGAQTVVSTNNFSVQSPYLLLNLTGGAVDGGIFFVTGSGLTGINDSGPIIGFDHSNKFKFGVSTRNSDLSTLPDIASVQDITAYSGFVDGKYSTIINLASTGSTLSTNLASTGSTLQTNINNLSNTYATITNLGLTGSTLVTNLASTGSTLATNLANTGSTLQTNINNLSGYINSSASNIVFTTGNQTISGNKTFNNTLSVTNISGLSGVGNPTSINIKGIDNALNVFGTSFLGGHIDITAGSGNLAGGNINLYAGKFGSTAYGGNINAIASNININDDNTSAKTINIYKTGVGATNTNVSIGQTSVNISNTFTISGVEVTPSLYATSANLASTGSTLVTNLASTGSTLQTNINNLSNTYATITNLASTGSTLTTNLANTGSTLQTNINNLSNTYATITNLASTGSTLNTRINNLSGYINSTSSNIVFTTGNQTISGTKTFIQDATFGDSAQGDFLVISGNQFTVYGSGNFTSGLFVNGNAVLTGNLYATTVNLASTGSTLDNKINNLSGVSVLTFGNQTINGLKTFTNTGTFNSGIDLNNSKLINATPDLLNVSANFNITGTQNSRVILANSPTIITGSIVSGNPIGFNTSIIQTSSGQVLITGIGSNVIVSSYNNQFRTAAQYATISILHTGNNGYIMYGNTST